MVLSEKVRVDFLCVENAGRSQMAAALAEQEVNERGLDGLVEVHSGGTKPADEIYETVIKAMAEVDSDISDRSPAWVVIDDLKQSHFVITMGCTISEFSPSSYGVEYRSWDLTDPKGEDIETVRAIRDELDRRVNDLFDEIETVADDHNTKRSRSDRVTDAIKNALSF